ncbi:DEAD/DEAH box helicase family protein [Neobacillus sp. M.A.Huq-85]
MQNEISPYIPPVIKIREYQQEAIRNWFRNNCQGLLEMATGTGKTITALSATAKLWEVTKRLGVVIVCPYTHLVDQWVKDIKWFGMSPIVAYQSKWLWEDNLQSEISAFESGIINHFCLITTVATFTSKTMQNILQTLNSEVLFIADEAHHLGAKKNRECLVSAIPYRLALSATPNRWHDEEGTDELIEYFGNSIVFKYGLDKAIGEFLTEYYYYPHIVYLDEDESEYYFEITKKIARMSAFNDSIDENESLQSLMIERSRIISRARNKLSVLKEIMKSQTDSKFNIVYCGDSKIDGEKQIDSVTKMLGNELDMDVHTFTSRETKEERKELLERFESGELQALVAIKCLDEGVDVPATQTAYILASSTNPREFIQRRGRVLRKHKNKQYSYIHDFIVVPRHLEEIQTLEPSLFNTERNLIKRELARFSEFADLAINGPLAHEKLNKLKHAYQLIDI